MIGIPVYSGPREHGIASPSVQGRNEDNRCFSRLRGRAYKFRGESSTANFSDGFSDLVTAQLTEQAIFYDHSFYS
jgi:hypothetical protein